MDLRDVVKLIRGEKGTGVTLTIIREMEKSDKTSRLIIPIIREEIALKDSDAKSHIEVINKRGKPYKVGYIKLPSFYEDPDSGEKLIR